MTRPKKPSPIEPPIERPDEPGLFTHPLLPGGAAADGKELGPPRVARFYVTRKSEKTGAWEFAPQAFGEHDLPGPEALFATYGGGLYWIRGQSSAGSWVAPFGVWPLSGPPKALHPAVEEPPPPAPPPAGMPGFVGPPDSMQSMLALMFQQSMAAQQQMSQLLGTVLTAVLAPRPAPPPDTLSRDLLTALVQRGSAQEGGQAFDQIVRAWKEGLGTGTEVAKVAAEAAAAGSPVAEPSPLDKALDTVAPVALSKMVDKVLGGAG